MTVKVIEQQQEDGSVKYFAYHAHIVVHGDPESDDFDPDDNHVVEVMAEIPNPVALATWRDPMPQDLMAAAAAGAPRPRRVVDVLCPDATCGSTSSYPSNGDPDARQMHKHYATFIGTVPQIQLTNGQQDALRRQAQGQELKPEEVPPSAVDRLHRAVHGVTIDGKPVDEPERQSLMSARAIEHHPIRPFVANDWALKAMDLPVPELVV